MSEGSDKATGGQWTGQEAWWAVHKNLHFVCFMGRPRSRAAEGKEHGTQASDTHRVLGRGTRRHREEKLPPQYIGSPWP